jgi:glycosyltransferase involved in cell wall biosynthesis
VVGRLAFAVPGDLATPTGGYAYDRRMIAELRHIGWQVDVIDLGKGFPFPTARQRGAAFTALSAVPDLNPIVIDGLAFGVLPNAAAALQTRHPLIALVHHPLALETGLTPETSADLRASEKAALACARRIIVTSSTTARVLSDEFGVAEKRITVARPGSDPAPIAKGSNDGIIRLLAIGSVTPRKGYDVLVAALAAIADLPWRLKIAGDLNLDLASGAALKAQIARAGLTERIVLLGAIAPERLGELYLQADVFTLASRYEGYGMALADAVAHGLPVVATTAGAIPEAVPASTSVLVEPDDVAALTIALRQVIGDPAARRRLADSARAAALHLPTWNASARAFSAVIEAAI